MTVNVGDKTAYLAEVQQAGIFILKGMTPKELHRTQHIFCLRNQWKKYDGFVVGSYDFLFAGLRHNAGPTAT